MFIYVKNKCNPSPEYVLLPEVGDASDSVRIPHLDAPAVLVPKTVEELHQRRSSKYWRERSRSERKFARDVAGLKFDIISQPDQLQKWLPKVHRLFLQRWKGEFTTSEWNTGAGFQPYSDAMLSLAPEGNASLAVLYRTDSDELLSFGYCLEQNRIRYLYQHASTTDPAYRKYGFGTILMAYLMRDTVSSGRYDLFDFMVGDLQYKIEWATHIQRTWRVIRKEDFNTEFEYRKAFLSAWTISFVRSKPILRSAIKFVAKFSPLRK